MKRMQWRCAGSLILLVLTVGSVLAAPGDLPRESLWIEAEHLQGVRGFCWPMGTPAMKKTDGHWGLSGPGWAAEWNQGGESGFLSIATAADDDRAVATKVVETPWNGPTDCFVWVRYGDWREASERFEIKLQQDGQPDQVLRFGEHAVVEEDNEMKLYWGWAFAWDRRPTKLSPGSLRLSLVSSTKETQPRQIDALVITTDASYRPRVKERPRTYAREWLDRYRESRPEKLAALVRKAPSYELPAAWKLRTFRDEGFLYLWNASETGETADWLGNDPQRVLYPYNLRDKDVLEAFRKKYGGQKDVPIFSDPRIVPAFHGAGPGVFATDATTGEVQPAGLQLAKWLDADPKRKWAMLMNYHPGKPIGPKGVELFQRYRGRYVGSVSGESLGYFYPKPEAMKAATAAATTRRQLVDAFSPLTVAENAAKYRALYGRDLDANAFEDVISCLSVGNIVFAPLLSQWGSRTLGYESSAATSTLLPMRWAFMRGLARQSDHLTATYRSCNFGDSATIFSNAGSYHAPQNIFDNYYSVFSGAGMTWYKMDIWYQYQAGSSMFYHEQGFDEYWKPGGTTAAGIRDVELSPKGKLVDRFLRNTAANPDRGHPFTPIAFLVDYAHGWEPSPYWPNSFKNWHQQEERFLFGRHERMLEEYFWAAWHPMAVEAEKPMTGTNEVYVPGVFGDVFDVICAYPQAERWKTIDSYPAVIVTGEIELTAAEGERLAKYVAQGGTLLVADAHLTGPGVAALQLPQTAASQVARGYRWRVDGTAESPVEPSQAYRFRPLQLTGEPWRVIAETGEGQPVCAAVDRGAGRLIYLSVPYGLGIDERILPIVPRLFAHLCQDQSPIDVRGDVQWMVNRAAQGWVVLLMNPAGQEKPQQGITPTDFRQNRRVIVRTRVPVTTARDRLLPNDPLVLRDGQLEVEVPAGGVRLLELK